jgi:hypothetical protein
MAHARSTILVGALSVCVFGCSSGSSGSSGSSETPDAAQVCNSLVDDGPTVRYAVVAAAAPTPAGGTITDGTYELASVTAYTGTNGPTTPNPSTARMVMVFAGSTVQSVDVVNGQEHRYIATFSVSGTTITMRDTCPDQVVSIFEITAAATELRIYATSSGITVEMRFTKR